MTEWEPATDAEVAMRDALRTDDQESYFRILADADLLLPVSADALAGLAPLGWGTWSTGGRTHVLAFTSPSALQACLADYTGSARRVPYKELAETWPNLEWWLAVNPGLPIEGYLPAWFVAQLARGDLRLPMRGPARDAGAPSQPPQDARPAAVAGDAAAAPDRAVDGGDAREGATGAERWPGHGERAGADRYGQAAEPAGYGPPAAGYAQAAGPAGYGHAAGAGLYGGRFDRASGSPPGGAPARTGPGGLPLRTPGAARPGGLPSRAPASQPASAAAAPSSGAGPGWPMAQAAGLGTGPSEGGGLGQGAGVGLESGSGQGAGLRRGATPRQGAAAGEAFRQEPHVPLPSRTPMAQTPPLPSHLSPPPTSERPPPMPGAAQAQAVTRTPTAGPARTATAPASPAQPAIVPPVIPGAGGADRPPGAGNGDRPPRAGDADGLAGADRRPRGDGSERTSIGDTGRAPGGGDDGSPVGSDDRPADAGPASDQAPAGPDPTASAGSPQSDASAPSGDAPDGEDPGSAGSSPMAATAGPASRDEGPQDVDFVPANDVERDLHEAADVGSTDRFLSTLLLATVLVPVAHHSRPGSAPGESGFAFRTEEVDGERFLVVFTSRDRLAEHFAEPTRTVGVGFYELIRNWPDPAWSFAVNPGSPIGAKYPGPQVIALANWATEAGLGTDPTEADERAAPVPAPQKVSDSAQHATVMQKTVPPEQVDYYLDRGYDRVAGFVHRANEVEHLRTPAELFAALGLGYDGSPFQPDAKEAYVLRWPAFRPSLYRIPYGGQSEQALRAMDGWVIERPPFRGNGFAPGEGRDVIAEFKVDSVRLPHGAQLWRMDADGTERMIAIFDCDAPVWRRVGER